MDTNGYISYTDNKRKKIIQKIDGYLSNIDDKSKNMNNLKTIIDNVNAKDNELKNFLINKIKNMTAENVNDLFGQILSLSDFLKNDNIQHILSFVMFNQNSIKNVNKTWNKLASINERNYYTNIINALKRTTSEISCNQCHAKKTVFKFNDQVNKIYLVHTNRTKLTNIEKELQFDGPFQSINDIFYSCSAFFTNV